MSSSQARLALLIDIFDRASQPAQVLPKIKPPQLVEAIIQEFREIEYLADDPTQYYLARADDETPLDDGVELGRQRLAPGAHLLLCERTLVAPEGAQPFRQRVYLREQSLGKVYRLAWHPAIIGRRAESQAPGEAQQIAVDLQPFPTGLRVSRRHLSIGESDGDLVVENLSNNPVLIQRAGGDQIPIQADKTSLLAGDIIFLERSQIALKVLLLSEAEHGAQGDLPVADASDAAAIGSQPETDAGVGEGS
jgi:hypothetical protein